MTVEVAVGLTMVIAALIAMAVYSQRAIQGSLKQSSDAHGLQFDPRDSYTEEHRLERRTEKITQLTRAAMVAADLIESVPPKPLSGQGDGKMLLKSLPTGIVFREPTAQESLVVTTWDARENSTYDDRRK